VRQRQDAEADDDHHGNRDADADHGDLAERCPVDVHGLSPLLAGGADFFALDRHGRYVVGVVRGA
jgi:hypothetical protein